MLLCARGTGRRRVRRLRNVRKLLAWLRVLGSKSKGNENEKTSNAKVL